MKQADVETINEIFRCLKNDTPIDNALFDKFAVAVDNINSTRAKQKQRYSENADVYRQRTKQWRKDNPEAKANYQKEYNKRDYVKKYYADYRKKKRKEAER